MDFPSVFTDTLDMDSPLFDTICICLLVDRLLRETMFFFYIYGNGLQPLSWTQKNHVSLCGGNEMRLTGG